MSYKEEKRPLQVFLSHASIDKPSVRDLRDILIYYGVDAWLDEENILPGQNWEIEIMQAVERSDVVIICLSKNSITKEGFFQKEIRKALERADEKTDETIFIIPLKLEDCDVPRQLQRWEWLDLLQDDGYQKLQKALLQRANQLDRQPVVRVFPHTPLFGRRNVNLVRNFLERNYFFEIFKRIFTLYQRNGVVATPILNIFGAHGIGKSVLLQLIRNYLNNIDAPSAIIEIKKYSDQFHEDPSLIVANIALQLKIINDNDEWQRQWSRYLNRYGLYGKRKFNADSISSHYQTSSPPLNSEFVTNSVARLVEEIKKTEFDLRPNFPIVVLIDDYDCISYDVTEQIEVELIDALLSTKLPFLFVLTSSSKLRWKKGYLRIKVQEVYLNTLSMDEYVECINANLTKKIPIPSDYFFEIYNATNGIPGTLPFVLDQVEYISLKSGFYKKELSYFVRKLTSQIYNKFIFEDVFGDLPEYLYYIVDLLSLVRRFDARFVRELFDKIGIVFQDGKINSYIHMLSEMQRYNLLVWDTGYSIDMSISSPIWNYYRVNHPAYFVFVNQNILEIFNSFFELVIPITTNEPGLRLVVDELYHQACLNKTLGNKTVNLTDLLSKRLEQSKVQNSQIEDFSYALDNLLQMIKNDMELSKLIYEKEFIGLLELIEKYQLNLSN